MNNHKLIEHSPTKEVLLKEMYERCDCLNYTEYSTLCDETFKRVTDWCIGCILKAAIDEIKKA